MDLAVQTTEVVMIVTGGGGGGGGGWRGFDFLSNAARLKNFGWRGVGGTGFQ